MSITMDRVVLTPRRGIELQSSIPPFELKLSYGACQWWLSKDWLLNDKETHPLQTLWRNPGWGSDVELYMIGKAIRELRRTGTPREIFEGKRREILGRQTGNQVGYLFELLVALLFIQGGHDAELLPSSAAGYDIDVFTPSGMRNTHILVSCKAMQMSEKFKKFSDTAIKLEREFINILQRNSRQGMFGHFELQTPDVPKGLPELETLDSAIKGRIPPGMSIQYEPKPWKIISGPTNFPGFASGFSQRFLSYTHVTYGPMSHAAERKRVLAKVVEANRGYKDHLEAALRGNPTLTALRVPTYLSVETVENWLQAEFSKNRYTSTSAILILQSSIVQNKMNDEVQTGIYTAYRLIVNPNAVVKWPLTRVNLIQPLGWTSLESPTIEIDGKSVRDTYLVLHGTEGLVVPTGTGAGSSNIPGMKRIVEWHGVPVDQWGGQNMTMEFPAIPREFTLL